MKAHLIAIVFSLLFITGYANGDSISEKKNWKIDTNYVVSYPDKLIIGLFQSWRFYELVMIQNLLPDTAGLSQMNYIARGNNSSGISFAYDKIGFSLSRSVDATEMDEFRKGITKTSNLSFSINSRKYRLEAAYRKYTGFYDNYTGRRDTTFIPDTSAFYQMPGMSSKAYRLKGFYFFNKKGRFSYGAAFNNNARQLKTAGSFLIISNLYSFSLYSDSSWISANNRINYPAWENWNYFRNLGLSANLGYTLNIVLFKRLFANLTGTLGLELQNYQYGNTGSDIHSQWKFGWAAGDLRGSLGYNGKRFYAMLSYIGDFSVYKPEALEITTNLHYGAFSFGYRFNKKEGKFIKWLKYNKWYLML